jgi:hypothetical protein
LVLRFALNARELSSRALWEAGEGDVRAARQGFALPRRMSSPPRKSRFTLAYAPALANWIGDRAPGVTAAVFRIRNGS